MYLLFLKRITFLQQVVYPLLMTQQEVANACYTTLQQFSHNHQYMQCGQTMSLLQTSNTCFTYPSRPKSEKYIDQKIYVHQRFNLKYFPILKPVTEFLCFMINHTCMLRNALGASQILANDTMQPLTRQVSQEICVNGYYMIYAQMQNQKFFFFGCRYSFHQEPKLRDLMVHYLSRNTC